jgi:streptogramin lyase
LRLDPDGNVVSVFTHPSTLARAMAVGPAGEVYVAARPACFDPLCGSRVYRLSVEGSLVPFAGTGTAGHSGDGGPALLADIFRPAALAVGPDGSVYVSDTGVGPGFTPTGTDAIWRIDPKAGSASVIVRGKDLDQPNVLCADQDGVFAVTWASGKLLTFSAAGARAPDIQLPKAQLDGVVRLPDGRFLITSWEGRCAYLVGKDGKASEWLHPLLDAPADLGLDLRRGRALIPAFQKDELRIILFPKP